MLRVKHLSHSTTSLKLCRHLGKFSREVANASFYKASNFLFNFGKKGNKEEKKANVPKINTNAKAKTNQKINAKANGGIGSSPKAIVNLNIVPKLTPKVNDNSNANTNVNFNENANECRSFKEKALEKQYSGFQTKKNDDENEDQPKRLDDIYMNHKKPIGEPCFLKALRELPSQSKENSSEPVSKNKLVNILRTATEIPAPIGSMGAAAKLVKNSMKQTNSSTKPSIIGGGSNKEVEKTHYDEKISVKSPLIVSEAAFTPFQSAQDEGNDEKVARLDDTHPESVKNDVHQATTLADYYGDLVNRGQLANIRIRNRGYSEKSVTWQGDVPPAKIKTNYRTARTMPTRNVTFTSTVKTKSNEPLAKKQQTSYRSCLNEHLSKHGVK